MHSRVHAQIVGCLVLAVSVGRAAEKSAPPAPGEGGPAAAIKKPFLGNVEYEILLLADAFSFGPVGIEGEPAHATIAYDFVSRQPWAKDSFQDLLRNATLPGQMYALCGMYGLDRQAFTSAAASYAKNKTTITVESHDLPQEEPASRLAGDIAEDGYVREELRKYCEEARRKQAEETRKARPISDYVAQLERGGTTAKEAVLRLGDRWHGTKAVPLLSPLLNHKRANVRKAASDVLGMLGPWARDAAPDLARVLDDTDLEVRRSAAAALASVSPFLEKIQEALTRKLSQGSEDEDVLCSLVDAAARMGKSGMSLLKRAKASPHESVRARAEEHLEKLEAASR